MGVGGPGEGGCGEYTFVGFASRSPTRFSDKDQKKIPSYFRREEGKSKPSDYAQRKSDHLEIHTDCYP